MKKLSDYKGADAIEIWADIFDTVTDILSDEDVSKYTSGKDADIKKACKVIMKKHPEEVFFVLNRIDDEPINGANAFNKTTAFLIELLSGREQAFFRSSEQESKAGKSSGSATENTEDGVK